MCVDVFPFASEQIELNPPFPQHRAMEQVEAGMMAVGMDVESEGPAAARADLGGGGIAEGGRAGAGFYIFRRCGLPEEAATAAD